MGVILDHISYIYNVHMFLSYDKHFTQYFFLTFHKRIKDFFCEIATLKCVNWAYIFEPSVLPIWIECSLVSTSMKPSKSPSNWNLIWGVSNFDKPITLSIFGYFWIKLGRQKFGFTGTKSESVCSSVSEKKIQFKRIYL